MMTSHPQALPDPRRWTLHATVSSKASVGGGVALVLEQAVLDLEVLPDGMKLDQGQYIIPY